MLPQSKCGSSGRSSSPAVDAPVSVPQVKAKYNATLMDLFREAFCWLPLAHCLNGKVLVVHGGLFSRDGVTLDELRAIDRFRRARAPARPCQTLPDPARRGGRADVCLLGCWQPGLSPGLHVRLSRWQKRLFTHIHIT